MRGKIDEILKQKYDEVEIPSDIFDFDKILKDVKPIKRKNKIVKFAASFVVIAVVVFGVFVWINKVNNSENTILQAEENTQLPTYSKEITIENNVYDFSENIELDAVYSVEVEEIIEYSTKNEGEYSYPITKVKAKVLNCYKGDKAEKVEFWVPGGIWSLSELKTSNLNYNENDVGMDESENIKINYYEAYKIEGLQIGKKYITCLYEENNGELLASKNVKYGFKEYDPETNMVNLGDNNWEELNLSDYLK